MDGGGLGGGGGGDCMGGGEKSGFSSMGGGDLPSYDDAVNNISAPSHMMNTPYPNTAFPPAGSFPHAAQGAYANSPNFFPSVAPSAPPMQNPGAYPQPMGPDMAPGAYPQPPMGPGMSPGAFPQSMGPGIAHGAYPQPMGPGMSLEPLPQPMGPVMAPGGFGQPMGPAQFGMPPSVYHPPPAPGPQPGLMYNTSFHVEEPSDDVILSVFEKLATKKSFFFNRPKNLREKVKIVNKKLAFRLRYTVETYVEKRHVYSTSHRIFGPHLHHNFQTRPLGDMWSYDLRPNDLWWEGKKDKVIQEKIDTCGECFGRCNKACHHCNGRGRVECIGFHDGNPPCRDCNGTRLRACQWCNGMAYSQCDECDGKGVVKVTVIVEAKFSVKKDVYFDGPDEGVPEKKLGKASGNEMLSHESTPPVPQLPPYPGSTSLNSGANDLLNKHYNQYVASGGSSYEARAIKQKHDLTSIPVTFVETKYKGKDYNLWVYGTDNSIYCPDMSSCSIL